MWVKLSKVAIEIRSSFSETGKELSIEILTHRQHTESKPWRACSYLFGISEGVLKWQTAVLRRTKLHTSLPSGKSEALDLPRTSPRSWWTLSKQNEPQRGSLILEIFCKEKNTDLQCPEYQSLPPSPSSGLGSKGVACVCRRQSRGAGIIH